MQKAIFLSIPGGGVRGALTVRPLLRLEKQTGKLCREIFSGVAGTSTGSLLAACIAAGVPMTKVAEMYHDKASDIFNHGRSVGDALLLERGYKYDIGNLHEVATETLGAAAALSLNAFPITTLITAKGVNGHQWYFTKDNPLNAGKTGKLKLIDCCVASSAAPTYFEPWTVPGIGLCVDGGVGVSGNPVYEFAYELFRYNAYLPEGSVMVSIGTGKSPAPAPPTSCVLSEIAWIIGELLGAPEALAPKLVRRHFPTLNFQSFDIPLTAPIEMDQASNVPALEAFGEKLADQMDWGKILA